jgi:hypothetical protein
MTMHSTMIQNENLDFSNKEGAAIAAPSLS